MSDSPIRRPGWTERWPRAVVTAAAIASAAVRVASPDTASGDPPGVSAAGPVIPVQAGPVTPPQFGFYGTQWRRWNVADPTTGKPGENVATPAGPPRSVVPSPQDEALAPAAGGPPPAALGMPAAPNGAPGENPRRRPDDLEPLPAPGDGAALPVRPEAATLPKVDPQVTGRFLAQLSRDAAAAKSAGPQAEDEFTRRLVAELLSAHDAEARRGIVETAAEFATPSAAAICSGAFEDPSPVVRMAACTACARRGGPDAVPRLARRYADDPDLGVRLRALSSLADTRDQAAVGTLIAALDDPDPAIRTRAIEGLKRVSGRDLGDDIPAWRRWANNPTQPAPRWSMNEVWRKLF
jgi:hypothetical protein